MPVTWAVWFVIGACAGSFLNVCIWRLPRGQSVVRPRSRCPHCGHLIAWYDNIPLASFLALGARCRHCRGRIHWRYPVVEATSGVLTVAVLERFGVGAQGLVYLAFAWALVAASFIDLEHQIIPDEISLGGLAAGMAASLLVPSLHGTQQALVALARSGIGALVGGGLLYLTGAFGSVMLGCLRRLGVRARWRPFWRRQLARYRHMKEAMGGGDIKLLAMAGSVLGWKLATVAFFIAPVIAVIPGVALAVMKRTHVIPYGPFLSLGLLVALFAGQQVLNLTGIEETVRVFWMFYGWGS